MRDRVLHRAFKRVLRNGLFTLSRFDRCFGGFLYSLVFQRRDFNNLAAQSPRQLGGIDFAARFLHNVHHVDRDNNGDPQLAELRCQVQVPLQIRAVYNVQDRVGTLVDQIVTCDDLLHRVRRKRVNSRKVGNCHVAVLFELSFLFLNGNARPVADKLIRSRQRVEQRCFSAVRVACQGNCHFHLCSSFRCL